MDEKEKSSGWRQPTAEYDCSAFQVIREFRGNWASLRFRRGTSDLAHTIRFECHAGGAWREWEISEISIRVASMGPDPQVPALTYSEAIAELAQHRLPEHCPNCGLSQPLLDRAEVLSGLPEGPKPVAIGLGPYEVINLPDTAREGVGQDSARSVYRAARRVIRVLSQMIGDQCASQGCCTDRRHECPARAGLCRGQYPGQTCSNLVLEGAMESLHVRAKYPLPGNGAAELSSVIGVIDRLLDSLASMEGTGCPEIADQISSCPAGYYGGCDSDEETRARGLEPCPLSATVPGAPRTCAETLERWAHEVIAVAAPPIERQPGRAGYVMPHLQLRRMANAAMKCGKCGSRTLHTVVLSVRRPGTGQALLLEVTPVCGKCGSDHIRHEVMDGPEEENS